MNIDIRNFLQTKIDNLEEELSANKLDLKLSSEKRQEIAILQKALLSHGLHDRETDAKMEEINGILTNLQRTIKYLS